MFGLFSKTAKARPAAALPDQTGCFGKMPVHPDFIRHNVGSREVVSFEKWVQEGIGLITRKHPAGWPEIYRDFPRFHFMLIGGEQERTLAGSLSASRDKSGRHYPFSVFVSAEAQLFRDMQAVVPLVYHDFFSDTEAILAEPWSSEPLALLTGRVDGASHRDTGLTRRQLLEQQIALLQQIPVQQLWQQAAPQIGSAGRERIFSALFSALRTVVRRGPTRTNWGIRLPIPADGSQTPFVVFWMQIIESVLEDRSWRAHCFWSRSGAEHPAALTVFFKPLPGSFLLQLLNPGIDDGSVLDLTREPVAPQEDLVGVDLKRLLASETATLLDVLYKAGRREALA